MTYCWYEPKDGYTCMLPEDHDGSHKPTTDDDILISLAPPEDTDRISDLQDVDQMQIIAGLLSTIDFQPSQHHPVQMEPTAKRIIRLLSEGNTAR